MNPGRFSLGCFSPAPGQFAATSHMRGSRGGGADQEGMRGRGTGSRRSDSFTILGLWVLGLAVSNINESQLQTYES